MSDYFFGRVMMIFIIMLIVLSPLREVIFLSVWIFGLVMALAIILVARLQGDDWLIQCNFIPVFLVIAALALAVSWYLSYESHVTVEQLFRDKYAPRYVRSLPIIGAICLYMAGIIAGFCFFRRSE